MRPYIGLVHQDPGSAFGITFPDAPGCFSAADSLDDLFRMANEALELWLDGLADDQARVPEVRELSVLKADPESSEAFADEVLVIAIPAPVPKLRAAA